MVSHLRAMAAEQLRWEPGTVPEKLRPIFKGYVQSSDRWLRERHGEGASGRALCQARSAMVDEVARRLMEALWPASGTPMGLTAFALVATGGYGRSELNPGSDVDLLFLEGGGVIREDGSTPLSSLPPAFIQMLYDIGLEPGDRSVRTVEQSLKLAAGDMESRTSLLEARFLAGDERLYRKLVQSLREKCLRGKESEYITERLADQGARRAKYGNSPCMQEPHIKNGVGGLRDYQNLLWMALVRYGVGTLKDLEEREMLSAEEHRQLKDSYDFLLRVRNELHYRAGRGSDTLTPVHQPVVAAGLGYSGDPRRRTERFMRDYYTAARHIHIITRTLEDRLALTAENTERKRWSELLKLRKPGGERAETFDGFQLVRGQVHVVDKRVLRDHPARMMRAFLHAQARGVPLHPDLAQFIRQQVSRLGDEFRSDEHVRRTFIQVLSARGNVAPALKAMHETGLLGRYIPEFDRLTNLVQHEYYHRYAVDEHTLVCIEKLDQVWSSDREPFRSYYELFRRLERPEVLYLALLLHDAGKAEDGGRHAEIGGQLALTVARRLELDPVTTGRLRLIIELHLAMVQTAQKRDLEDPRVIRAFADQVQDLENLELLTLHTFADSMGTSESLWSGFKDSLHWELHHRTRELLTGDTGQIRAQRKQLQLLEQEVRGLLPKTFAPDEIEAHFTGMPGRYFQTHAVEEIARDLTQAHQFMHLQLTVAERALEPVIHWHDERDRGHTVVHICTWDRAGLFSKITGALAAAGLNIYGAQIYTRHDGVIFDEFYVVQARTGQLPVREEKQKFEQLLLKVLTGNVDLAPAIAKTRLLRPLWIGVAGDTIPTQVRLDNEAAADRTLIEVEAEDRVGLLYRISETLAELRLDLILAKIVTEKGAAIDSFYVTEIGGGKVEDPERQQRIVRRLEEAIRAHDA